MMTVFATAMRWAALHFLLLWGTAVAQIYPFEATQVPKNRTLHTLYAFYVFSEQEAPDKSLGKPFVEFNGLACHSTSASRPDATLGSYQSVQLSILRYRDFWNVINPKQICTTWGDVVQNKATAKDMLRVQRQINQQDIYMHTVRFPNASHPKHYEKRTVEKTGVYILIFSNCGDFDDATVSGNVVVKNAYGFLPGNEYYKMPFYGWLLLVYAGLALVWLGLSFRWWKELFHMQNCIAAVILFGLLEAFMWYIFYSDWNAQGVRGKAVFIFATLLTVVKSTFSYMLVLVASLGWGVTRPFLDRPVMLKIQLLCFFYIVLDFIRETVLSYRHSHTLSLAFVLLCLLPVSLLNGGIFYWIFTALSNLMETLKERGQTEKLTLFERLWKFLIWTLTAATFTLLFQILNLTKSVTERWKYQWVLSDGISHTLYLLVLAAMMYLWKPHENSQRYAYSTQVDDCENPMPLDGPPQADVIEGEQDKADVSDGEQDKDESDSIWATTGGRTAVAPADVIGASGPADQEDRATF